MTYAQNGEDDILAAFFDRQRTGFFVDVGAYDGTTYSNTLLFEQRGWHGLCIEPNPEPYALCRAARPGSTCIQAACIGTGGSHRAALYLSAMPILATLDPSQEAAIAIIHANCDAPFTGFTVCDVPAATLDAILEAQRPPAVDLVSIDTEWTNADVLHGFTLARWRPRVVIVEVGDGVEAAMGDYYFVREHGSNLFYVRDVLDIKRMAAA